MKWLEFMFDDKIADNSCEKSTGSRERVEVLLLQTDAIK